MKKTSLSPRGTTGVHNDGRFESRGRDRRGTGRGTDSFGARESAPEPVIWDRLFPRGRGRWRALAAGLVLTLMLVTVAVVAMCGAFADPKRGGGADT